MIAKHLKFQMLSGIASLFSHTLYTRLLVLLLCIVISIVLMQAGSLFLGDYIPTTHSAIQKIRQQEFLWKHHLEIVASHPAATNEVLAKLGKSESPITDETALWLERQDDEHSGLMLKRLQSARADFTSSLWRAPTETKLANAQAVATSYGTLAEALEHDMEIKQSVISLLQLVGMALVMCCVGAIALGARRVLVDRLDHLLSFVPAEFVKDVQGSSADEFVRLEKMVYEIAARLEGFKAETQWVNQSSGEKVRRLMRSQDFLFKFVELINHNVLSEMTLRKVLYSLEKTLDVNNVALIFTEHDSVSTERVLFSHHWPALLQKDLLEDAENSASIDLVFSSADGARMRCLAVPFSGASGELAILKVEAEEEREFETTEKQLVEVTSQLLSMVMGFQSREQEGRRVALLEERAAIARELHDSLAQSLSYMKIQIARLQSNASAHDAGNGMNEIVNELREGLDSAYRELRELLATFRVHMDVRGLGFAIQSAIDEFVQRSSLSITLDNRLVNCRLTVNEEFHILHVVREALSNIVRHSGASNVVIALVFQSNGSVMVTIDDDGVGYVPSPENEPHHYGQAIMKERAYSLGGDIQVMTRRKGGTRVRLIFNPKLAQ